MAEQNDSGVPRSRSFSAGLQSRQVRGGRPLQQCPVRREARTMQWTIPTAFGVVPAQYPPEVGAYCGDAVHHAVNSAVRGRCNPVPHDSALALRRFTGTSEAIEYRPYPSACHFNCYFAIDNSGLG